MCKHMAAVVAMLALAAGALADVSSSLRSNRQAIIVDPVRSTGTFLVAGRSPSTGAAIVSPGFSQFPQTNFNNFRQYQQYPQAYSQQYQFQPRPFFRILKQTQEQDPAGYYRFSFETENGISASEEGTVVRPGTSSESTAKQGGYSYTGPDGVVYSVSYIADDDGFRASGAHLPTPPPIPAAIQRALELNAREEGRYDDNGFLKK